MRLWMMRDEKNCGHDGTMLWQSNDPPVSTLGIWVFAKDDGIYLGSIEYDVQSGTCTELYTEREVRERVAKAYADAGEGLVFHWADSYLESPTDENWARLMAEVGAGGATNV